MSLIKIKSKLQKPLFNYVNCFVAQLQKLDIHSNPKSTYIHSKPKQLFHSPRFCKFVNNALNSHLRNQSLIFSTQVLQRNFSTSEEPTSEVPSYYDRYIFPHPPDMVSDQEHDIVIEKVNEAISNPERGRLFAIVHVAGNQFKITDNDLIKAMGKMIGVKQGDRIRLEKVLLVGGEDFTLVGRPLLRRSVVRVEATVLEITPGVEKVIQYFRRGESFQRRYFYTPFYTILRINSVQAFPELS